MTRRGISQEGLKLLACITMLIDHIGLYFQPSPWLRVIGRLAFPIYCFLLAEGVHYTKNPRRYFWRLLFCAALSEIAFDLLHYNTFPWTAWVTWRSQSVMVTLLLGFLALEILKGRNCELLRLAGAGTMILLGEWTRCNYGGEGVALVILFGLTRNVPHKWLLQAMGMFLLFGRMGSMPLELFGRSVPIQVLGVFSMVPIMLYSGEKRSRSKALQWGFYLFYPVHQFVIYGLRFVSR